MEMLVNCVYLAKDVSYTSLIWLNRDFIMPLIFKKKKCFLLYWYMFFDAYYEWKYKESYLFLENIQDAISNVEKHTRNIGCKFVFTSITMSFQNGTITGNQLVEVSK